MRNEATRDLSDGIFYSNVIARWYSRLFNGNTSEFKQKVLMIQKLCNVSAIRTAKTGFTSSKKVFLIMHCKSTLFYTSMVENFLQSTFF